MRRRQNCGRVSWLCLTQYCALADGSSGQNAVTTATVHEAMAACSERNQSDDQWAVLHYQLLALTLAAYTCTAAWCLFKMYLWVGGSLVSGSGKRGHDAGRRLSVSLGTCARSYWPLDFTKPKTGRHGARGASWRNKCPFWMSSTQWGVVETVWAEGAVAGSMWAALATLLLCLWACPYGNRGLTFCNLAGAQEQSHLHSRAHLEVNIVICLPSTAPYVRVFLACPPPHPGMGVFPTGGVLVSGRGERGLDAGRRLSVSLGTCARSYWPLDFTKTKTGRHGARGASWRNKCPCRQQDSRLANINAIPPQKTATKG